MTYSSKQLTFLAVAIWAVALTGITAGMATFGVAQLDKSTAIQCRTHDWPASAHKVHINWCTDNGYVTK